jgi:YesN/AraC family two-component response regulator
MKLLIVDPDVHSRDHLLNLIDWEGLGFEVAAPDYRICEGMLQKMDKLPYELVVIHSGQLPSYCMQLCENIRKVSPVPIVLVGGIRDFHIVKKAIALQVSDYLPDPYRPEDLAACLMNVRDKLQPAVVPAVEKEPSASIIDIVKRYVQDRLDQNITLKEISNQLHFNSTYLGQKFKRHMNMTFNEYVLQQRMEKAKRLLQETDMRIYEIAHQVGYSEVDWFYKKFKEYVGTSANEYRKRPSCLA